MHLLLLNLHLSLIKNHKTNQILQSLTLILVTKAMRKKSESTSKICYIRYRQNKVQNQKKANILTYQAPHLQTSQKRVRRKMARRATTKVTIKEKKTCQQVDDASISYALQKKYTKKSDLGSNKTSTAFSVKIAMKTTLVTSSVNFASKFIR